MKLEVAFHGQGQTLPCAMLICVGGGRDTLWAFVFRGSEPTHVTIHGPKIF